jgi:hypothetical protein
MSILDKVRKWIDGETSELVLEQAARDAQVKPRSPAEEFIVKIARAVEEVMQREIVPLPQGTAIIPTEYTVFLSNDDDKEWQGVKRRGLEQGLYHILAERAKEIAGKKKLETKSFAVQLRVDGTLAKNEVRVQHSWEDSEANKTSILARPKPLTNEKPKPVEQTPEAPDFLPNFPTQNQAIQNQPVSPNQIPPTVLPGGFPPIQPATNFQNPFPYSPENVEEATRIQKRGGELYKLEIWHNGQRKNIVPIFQRQVVIGRGSKSKPVDIPLVGDPEISRRHLIIYTDGNGNFSVINEGRNPAVINNYELPIGQQISVDPGVLITVGKFLLRIQPKI